MSLRHAFRRHLATLSLPPGSGLVAVSGGPDSVALLDLMAESRDLHRIELVVAHVDHGIHPDSERVAEQVRALASAYGLPFEAGRLALGPSAGETLARARRYAWLEALQERMAANFIFTAHHADDQVETVLMRALHGSGPAGLAAMAPVQGPLVRPLLPFTRVELLAHVEEAGLTAWSDPANCDPRHLRSWIRTELLPVIRHRLPDIDGGLRRLSAHAAADRNAWDAVLDALPALDLQVEQEGISVAASALADYVPALKQAVLLALARRVGCSLGPSRVGRVITLLQNGASGAWVPLGANWAAELAFGRLRMASREPRPSDLLVSPQFSQGEARWGRWHFRWRKDRAPEEQERIGLSSWLPLEPVTIRGWNAGEKLTPLGGKGRRLIVRCFQDVRVPRSRRASWPVLVQRDKVIWIPGVCRSDVRLPTPGTEALRVDAEHA